MLRLLKNFFSFKQNIDKILKYPKGKRLYKEHHHIREHHIDPDALKVLYRINSFGYTAYLVGGSIRDLLLEKKPKDFDVVTNATPKDLKKIFNNSRIIGKRFKIIHIFFNGRRKTIEITTSRSLPQRYLKNIISNKYLSRDNKFGSFRDDIARRDITINALLFDAKKEIIIDYVGGVDDIKNKKIEIIGDESYSFQEDPVRIIRAIKFASIYNFSISDKTIKYIQKYTKHLNKISRNRFHEECNKIFYTGKSYHIFKKIYDVNIFKKIFPNYFQLASLYDPNWNNNNFENTLLGKVLHIADAMIQEYHEINTNTYFGLLMLCIFENPLNVSQKTILDTLHQIKKEFGLNKKILLNLFNIFKSQSLFDKEENNQNLENVLKKEKQNIIIEAFIVYKTYARALNNEKKIQHSLFWEMHLPTKVTNPIQRKRYFHIDDKKGRPTFNSKHSSSPQNKKKNYSRPHKKINQKVKNNTESSNLNKPSTKVQNKSTKNTTTRSNNMVLKTSSKVQNKSTNQKIKDEHSNNNSYNSGQQDKKEIKPSKK